MSSPPVARGLPLVGHLFDVRRDPLAFFSKLTAEHGGLATFRAGPYRITLVNEPDAIRDVLMNDVDRFRKGFGNDLLAPLIGRGLFLAEGEAWRRQREAVQPLFRSANLDRLETEIAAATERLLDAWASRERSGERFELHAELRELTLAILSVGLVGSDVFETDPELRDTLEEVWRNTNERVAPRFPWLLALQPRRNARHRRSLAKLHAAILAAIRRRRGAPQPEHLDLLSILLSARPGGRELDDDAVRDEVLTFLVAGQECTAIALSWTLYLLARHPEEEARVRAELGAGDSPALRAAVDETLRLYPPAWLMARQNVGVEELGGHRFPADSIFYVSPWVTHRDPRWWPEPARFRPERFGAGAPKPRPFTYFPFSLGPRTCVGRPLALRMTATILPRILRRYRVQLASGEAVRPDPGLTLRPRGGIPVTIHAAG